MKSENVNSGLRGKAQQFYKKAAEVHNNLAENNIYPMPEIPEKLSLPKVNLPSRYQATSLAAVAPIIIPQIVSNDSLIQANHESNSHDSYAPKIQQVKYAQFKLPEDFFEVKVKHKGSTLSDVKLDGREIMQYIKDKPELYEETTYSKAGNRQSLIFNNYDIVDEYGKEVKKIPPLLVEAVSGKLAHYAEAEKNNYGRSEIKFPVVPMKIDYTKDNDFASENIKTFYFIPKPIEERGLNFIEEKARNIFSRGEDKYDNGAKL
ncbi:MAG: hypothetical protein HRT47_03350 [Candidatus Caenarcaniphilales bacterium]|nr:hypothetical protein [Candidatus Caenarcaniphilales bacterium]